MRYAIIADIHGNLAAFQAVLHDIDGRGGVGRIWCLGDVVGYGPDPCECIELLRRHDHVCVAGNHDWAALGKADLEDFNPEAAAASVWTMEHLCSEELGYLGNLPLSLTEGDFTLVHGSPREPVWEYLLTIYSARISFDYFQTKYCLVGHSHVPLVFELSADGMDCLLREVSPDTTFKLEGNRLIINPGGVGQPRNGDPRASYALYDSEQGVISYYRVSYDIATTQQRMREKSLPQRLITRLSYGL